MSSPTVLVTGAGGFIGHHLVKALSADGYAVRGVDIKEPEFEPTAAAEFHLLDLRELGNCLAMTQGVADVYHLAANMGGIGFITDVLADVTRDNVWMNANMLDAARQNEVKRFFFSSTACVYPMHMQDIPDVAPLKEADAHPAAPEEGYGWEKLFTEKMCEYYAKDHGLSVRVARFHNVYGPLGTYDGGREKAPAALCRKIALAKDGGEIEVWGDGKQTRSFMYVDDCVAGIRRLMESGYSDPLNLGTDRMVSVNELVDIVANAAGKKITKRHDTTKPQGVRGRNSDNSLLEKTLNWKPSVSLEDGMAILYKWVEHTFCECNKVA